MKKILFTTGLFLISQLCRAIDGPLTPQQAIDSFKLDPGLKIECVASEPMVINPVAVAWDEKERMFVVEDRGYPIGPGKGKDPVGQVVMLTSSHHDGHYDQRTVYADKLTFPNGVMCWKGGIFVTCAPYLYYFKDTKGDGVADVKQIVFKGFQDLSTTQLRVSHPVLNIDGWIYLTSGLTSAKVTSPLYPNHPEVFCHVTDFRFLPDTDQFEPAAGTAQFGETFDSFGRKFICSNRNHNQMVMLQLKYAHRNPNFAPPEIVEDIPDHGAASRVYPASHNITTIALHTGYFTSACGIFDYRGAALPEEYKNNTFTCEPAGNLVHRDVISQTNSGFVARRAKDGVEFLASPDNWFRPVNLASGPDGALYVCDMYRKTIEHPDYLPEATRKITDFESGKDKGRIYRITAIKPRAKESHVDLSRASTRELCRELNNPDAWWRTTAQRQLLERNDVKAAARLKTLLKEAKTPETRVLALQLLNGLGALREETLLLALKDRDVGVRENALQLSESRLADSAALTSAVLSMADDNSQRIRFQTALSLGELTNSRAIPALAKITEKNPDDPWVRSAVLTSVDHHADKLLTSLIANDQKSEKSLALMVAELAKILGASESRDQLSEFLDKSLARNNADSDIQWQQAAITGLAEGLHRRDDNNELSMADLLGGDAGAGKNARKRIDFLATRCRESLTNSATALSQRLIDLRFLTEIGATNNAPLFVNLIDPQQPVEIQVAAIRALANFPIQSGFTGLLAKNRWNTYSPPVREAILTRIMAKPELINALLDAVQSGAIPPWSINEDRRNFLGRSKDVAIKNRAAAIFNDSQSSDRMKVYNEYKSILSLKPDPQNGHAVFSRICTGCHMVGNEGHLVGPDLTGIRNQPSEVLLLHIIIPEYEIMPTYTCYNLETKDGNSYTGLLAAETPSSVTLRQALGHEETIQRSNIASMTSSRLSLMPDELEKSMSKQDLADLIGFLKGL